MRKGVVDYRRLAAADHSDLSLGVDALGTDFRSLHSELLNYGGYRASNVRQLPAAQLTAEWLQQSGAFRPLLLPAAPNAARDLGIALPEGSPTVDRLASRIGLPFEVHTMDVQTQCEGPRWTLHQWCLYWDARRAASREAPAGLGGTATGAGTVTAGGSAQQGGAVPRPRLPAEDEADSAAVKRKRSAEEEAAAQQLKGISADSKKRLLEVMALPLTGTALEAEISPPAAVRAVDLAQQVWPVGAPSRPTSAVSLVMSPEGGYTDFHLAAGGASVWLHCLSGRRSLALVPPTPRNLATYTAWAASARHAGVFLPAHCEGVVRLELGPGDTLIIPGGWARAAATTSSCVMLGGSFLRRDALTMQLEAWRIEDHLALRPRFRYPAFKQVMWYAAAAFTKRLRRLTGQSPGEVREQAAARLAAWAAEEEQAAAAKVQAGGSVGADSDSVSKAGAAKKKKGWLAGGKETADDAATRPTPRACGGAVAVNGGSGMRPLQLPAAALARPNASPVVPAGLGLGSSPAAPRQIGQAMGGCSRLQHGGGGGRGRGAPAVARVPPRMNPTRVKFDIGGSGGGGGGGGGGFRHPKRQCSPDSFIEHDSMDEASSGRGRGCGRGILGEDEDEVEWAPQVAAAAGGSSGEEMSDASEEEGLDLAELEAAGAGRRHGSVVVLEVGEDGKERPRRLTARQAARQAAAAEAWDGRITARHTAAGGGGGWSDGENDFNVLEDDEGLGGWGGGGGSARRARQSTRFGGKLPPRLVAMLQDEEADEAEERVAAGVGGGEASTAAAALAAFAAAEQQQQFAAAAPASCPIKIRVKAPTAPTAAPAAGKQLPLLPPPQQLQQPVTAPTGKLKIKIKPAGGGSGSAVPQQQQQQQEPIIPQVDGAGDDQLDAMYDALYDEGAQQQRRQQGKQQPAAAARQEVPPGLAAPLGQAGQPWAGAVAASPPRPWQQQKQEEQEQQGATLQGAGNGGWEVPARQHSASRRLSVSSVGQLATGGQDGSVGAHCSGGSQSPSVEGPAAAGQQGDRAETPAAETDKAEAAAAAVEEPAVRPDAKTKAVPASASSPGQLTPQPKQGQQPDELNTAAAVVSGEHRPVGSSGAAPPPLPPPQQEQQEATAVAAPAPAAYDGLGGGSDDEDVAEGSAPQEALSLEEEDGLAALLAALKQWLAAPHALNDVPLSIANPKALVARLEVCMRALGLSLAPPPPVDLDSVPLERLLPVRTPRAGGTQGMPPSHQTPQTLGGSEFAPGELDAVGELEEGGEFDPADLLEEGGPGGCGVVVEESAGPKSKLPAPTAAKASTARAGGSAGRAPAVQADKRKTMSIKDRLKKKLKI